MSEANEVATPQNQYPKRMGDVFRMNYRALSDRDKLEIARVKELAQQLYDVFDHNLPCREMALAKTHLEEAVMWATKALT